MSSSEVSVETPRGKTWYTNRVISRTGGPAVIIYFKDTTTTRIEKWYLEGRLHRSGGLPAITEYEELPSGTYTTKKKEEYYENGRLTRTRGPARIFYENIRRDDATTSYTSEEYYLDGKLHNGSATVDLGGGVSMPYAIKSYEGELKVTEGTTTTYTAIYRYESYVSGTRQSVGNSPAIVKGFRGPGTGDRYWYNTSGRISRTGNPAVEYETGAEEWWSNGKLSRTDNATIIIPASYTGGLEGKTWYLENNKHRIGGEAVFLDTGILVNDKFFKKSLQREYWTYGRNHDSTTTVVSTELKEKVLLDPPSNFTLDSVQYTYSTVLSSKNTAVFIPVGSETTPLVGYIEQGVVLYTTGLSTRSEVTTYESDGISIKDSNIYDEYRINGVLHREGGAALASLDGSLEYWVEGKIHRSGDLPAILREDGTKEYYTNGLRNRTNGPAVEYSDGSLEYWVEGQLHRSGDLPAIIRANGTKEYYTNGLRNRTNGPAIEYPPKTIGEETFVPFEYWVNGVITRGGDQPAVRRSNGSQEWYLNGKLHRSGDLPAIIHIDGSREWYENGLLNRVGQPAVTRLDGYKAYYRKGKLQRTGGAAVEYPDGSQDWYILIKTEDAPPTTPLNVLEDRYTLSVLSREDDEPAVIRKDKSGTILLEEYWVDGFKTRSDDKPAVIVRNSSGEVVRQEWWNTITYESAFNTGGITGGVQNTKTVSTTINVLSRDANPAVIEIKDGVTREEYWDRGGKNVVGGPAVIEFNDDHTILNEYWRSTYDEEKDLVISSVLERDPKDLTQPVIEKFDPVTGVLVYKVQKNSEGGFEFINVQPIT